MTRSGDLHPEHIFFIDPPVIIDRLEFNRALRTMDYADEVSFLELECQILGTPETGEEIKRLIFERMMDTSDGELLVFYRARHLLITASLAAAHFHEPRREKDQMK